MDISMDIHAKSVDMDKSRINHLVGPTHSTTPEPHRKLDAEEGERGGRGVPPKPTRVWERCISSSAWSRKRIW